MFFLPPSPVKGLPEKEANGGDSSLEGPAENMLSSFFMKLVEKVGDGIIILFEAWFRAFCRSRFYCF